MTTSRIAASLAAAPVGAAASPPALRPMQPAATPVVTLRPYQQDAVERVRAAMRTSPGVLLVLPTGGGKCLARGTPVLRYDGLVMPVEDIRVGDLLMGPDGQPRRVESLARGREAMYKVTPTKGEPYTVNESHVLSLRNTAGAVMNVSVSKLLAHQNLDCGGALNFARYNGFAGWRVPGVLQGDLKPELTSISVAPVGEGDYYGFELSGPDRLFLLGDFTVTHNTVCFSYIANSASKKGNRVLILAHRDTLIKQASAKLNDSGVQHGIIMAGFTPMAHRPVQVASVQTLVRRIEKMVAVGARFDVVVVDEAHLSAAASYGKIIKTLEAAHEADGKGKKLRVLGVTGSPIRLDGRGLGREWGCFYDDIVVGIGIRQLIAEGYLVRPKYYASKDRVDWTRAKVKGQDFDQESVASIMDQPHITGDAIRQYQKVCPGVPAIAWCANVAHAKHVAAEFNAAGIKAVALSGEDDPAERDRVGAALQRGDIKVVTFAMLLVEGVDWPAIGCVIMLRLTMALASYLQTIGRGLRPVYAPGMPLDTVEQRQAAIDAGPKGRHLYVLDHAGLVFRHGFAEDDRDWSLDGEVKGKGKKKAEPKGPAVEQCPKCWIIHPPAPVCPGCGHRHEAKPQTGPEHVDGELAEITEEAAEAIRRDRRREVARATTLDELNRIGAERGYKPGWGLNVFNARKRRR